MNNCLLPVQRLISRIHVGSSDLGYADSLTCTIFYILFTNETIGDSKCYSAGR